MDAPVSAPTEWYRDHFLISIDPSLIQPASVNAAFGSDMLYWCKPIADEALLKEMLNNSLCFGVYALPSLSSDIVGRGSPQQIGLARVITDKVSFAYLTDVYILNEFQGKGLGSWLIECVNEIISSWPELRRALLVTSSAQKFYSEKLGMQSLDQGKNGLTMMSRKGPGSMLQD